MSTNLKCIIYKYQLRFKNTHNSLLITHHSQSGISLLETVIAAMISMVVGIILLGILGNHTGFFYKQNTIVNEGVNLNEVSSQINRYIKEAAAVALGYPVAFPTYTSDIDTLVLKLPALSQTGTISNVYDYVVIEKDSGNLNVLRLQILPDVQSNRQGANTVLTTLLDQIQFIYRDESGGIVSATAANQIEMNLTILSKVGTIESKRTVNSKTTLRNN